MSLTLAGAAIGFLSSVTPEIVNYFKDKEQKKKDIHQLNLEMQMLEKNADIDLIKFRAQAQDNEHARLLNHDETLSKEGGFFGGLRKSVRPLVTYSFFGLFAFIKVVVLQELLSQEGAEFIANVDLVWDSETKAIFAAIMSFWFGDRAISKYREAYKK